nr:MAG: PilZ domain-containing protein [Hyphomicrobiales bacterium]
MGLHGEMDPPVTSLKASPEQQIIARAKKERRRFRRVRVSLSGRLYIPATQEEATCVVEDISAGDATLICELKSEPQGRAVIYLNELGRFEGPVVRGADGGFVMTFSCSMQKREKLVDQLTVELNRHLLEESDLPKNDRAEEQAGRYAHFTRSSGEQIRYEIFDLSLTGLSARTEIKPPIGEHVLVGTRAGRVARHYADGIVIEFLGAHQWSQNPAEMPSDLATIYPPSRTSRQ